MKRYRVKLFNFLYRYCSDRELAEDVLQEVFIKVYFAAPKLKELSHVSAWMYKIATNTVISQLRKRRALSLVPFTMGTGSPTRDIEIVDKDLQAHEDLERREDAHKLKMAIERLPDKYRMVIVLQYVSDLPLTEIAKVLGKPVGTIKSLSSRGRDLLKKELS